MLFNSIIQLFRKDQPTPTTAPIEQEMVDFRQLREEEAERVAQEEAERVAQEEAIANFQAFRAGFFDAAGGKDGTVYGRPVEHDDQGTTRPFPKETLAALTQTSKGLNQLFKPALDARTTIQLTQHVVYGEEAKAIGMIKANPSLLTNKLAGVRDISSTSKARKLKSTVTDYSGRIIHNVTPFQAALCAGDEVMAKKMKAIYLEANPENGKAVLDAQFNEVFPNGYVAHLEEQKRSADEFERDFLNPLVAAFDNASIADLQAALAKQDNGSDLCQKLREFKDVFHALSMQEKVYNPNHLQKVFEKYNAKFDGWYVNGDNPHRWLRLDLFWRQVIGWEERYMTANYAQSFCTGLGNMVDEHLPLQRTLTLRDYDTNRVMHFFPLDVDPSSKLGADFGVYSYDWAWGCGSLAACYSGGGVGGLLSKLMSSKNSELGRIMQPESRRRNSPGCLIQ